jgi:hypothetical protein
MEMSFMVAWIDATSTESGPDIPAPFPCWRVLLSWPILFRLAPLPDFLVLLVTCLLLPCLPRRQ